MLCNHVLAQHEAEESGTDVPCPVCGAVDGDGGLFKHIRQKHYFHAAHVRPDDLDYKGVWTNSAGPGQQAGADEGCSLTFVGTGSSTGTPILFCLRSEACCPTCTDSLGLQGSAC